MHNLGNRFVNNWIYPVSDGYVLIDTGYENGFRHFEQRLTRLNIKLTNIRYVFLTHAHDDHAGFLNQLLTRSPDVKVIMSRKSPEVLFRGQNSFLGGCTTLLALLFCHFMKLFGKGEHRFPPVNRRFEDRFLFVSDSGQSELEAELGGSILHTPGHTADSISLLLDDGTLFCGDAAMNGFPGSHNITIWAEDKNAFADSWIKIVKAKPRVLCPGHGRPFIPEKLKRNLPYARRMTLRKL